jgi:hypothetical protein
VKSEKGGIYYVIAPEKNPDEVGLALNAIGLREKELGKCEIIAEFKFDPIKTKVFKPYENGTSGDFIIVPRTPENEAG